MCDEKKEFEDAELSEKQAEYFAKLAASASQQQVEARMTNDILGSFYSLVVVYLFRAHLRHFKDSKLREAIVEQLLETWRSQIETQWSSALEQHEMAMQTDIGQALKESTQMPDTAEVHQKLDIVLATAEDAIKIGLNLETIDDTPDIGDINA